LIATFDDEGVLVASLSGEDLEFSATLHRHNGIDEDRSAALEMVNMLARNRGIKPKSQGTYQYFLDATDADPNELAHRFWTIGIPGAMVVVSILAYKRGPDSALLKEVWNEVPHLVGELG
jgi:hypothetical protein